MISIHQRHPLHRDGTNRVSRLLKALAPDYFKLDDRSMQDIMVAAHRYAQQLSYINEKNQPDGDWSAFWEVETLTYLAVLSALDTEELRRKYDDADYALATALENYNPAKGKPNPVPGLYRDLLNILFDMAKGIEEMYLKLVAIQHPMQSMLLNLIKRDNQCDFEELDGALQKLVALHKGADDKLVHERYNLFYAPDDRWGIPNRKQYDLIKPDIKLNREKLRALFITFFNVYLLINHRGQMAFDAELALMEKPEQEAYRIVQPHVSLFIAFLRLFRHAQDSLNELTKKQLDYYYENILCLGRQAAKPDHVHLIFTLAKNFDQELIEKGTLLLGGKDKNGQPMYYETLQDWVVTQAQVAEVKTVFVAKKLSFNDTLDYDDFKKSLLATSFVPDGSTPHRIFGDDGLLEEPEIGFVIASPQLWLEEGNRWISIKINNITQAIFSGLQGSLTDNIGVAVSTKKDWIKLSAPKLVDNVTPLNYNDKFFIDNKSDLAKEDFNNIETPLAPIETGNHIPAPPLQAGYAMYYESQILHIQVFLPADFDALEPLEEKPISSLPAIKIYLKKEALRSLNSPYEPLLRPYRSDISISVRAEGVSKSLIIQTDNGKYDGTQQILPFGATVPMGAKMYIGNQSAFLKKLDLVKFTFDWVGTKGKYGKYYKIERANSGLMDVEFLKDNVFKSNYINLPDFESRSLTSIFYLQDYIKENLIYTFNNLDRSKEYSFFQQFDPSLNRGFFRFAFQGDFGHSDFAERLSVASLALGKVPTPLYLGAPVPTSSNLPNPPYTPTFNSIKMDYISADQAMEYGLDEFYYLHAFEGYEKQAFFEKEIDAAGIQRTKEFMLFPDYTVANTIQGMEGHLYIGLNNLIPGSNLSLLVQTMEGSERNAEKDVPQLHWSYLSHDNMWVPIAPDKILSDTTRQFTRSGVIQIAISRDISSVGNTLLDPALMWLRVSAETGTGQAASALPSLVHLQAQVVEAQLRLDQGLEPVHLAEGQPASSISKLATSRSAVKKIEQPASTFDGRVSESSGLAFYQRISERLRHRNRAITAWDYERLLLHRFSDVASAKCVNHTQYKSIPESELAPGFVTIALIPDLRKRSGQGLAMPRFPKGDLDEMRDYLNGLANLFLKEKIGDHKYLQLVNAQFEELLIDIKVKFKPKVDEAYFKIKLSEDLRNHIATWLTDSNSPPVFGRRLRKSALIRFVEDLAYIDYVESLKVSKIDKTYPTGGSEGEDILPESDHAILTSANKHLVNSQLL